MCARITDSFITPSMHNTQDDKIYIYNNNRFRPSSTRPSSGFTYRFRSIRRARSCPFTVYLKSYHILLLTRWNELKVRGGRGGLCCSIIIILYILLYYIIIYNYLKRKTQTPSKFYCHLFLWRWIKYCMSATAHRHRMRELSKGSHIAGCLVRFSGGDVRCTCAASWNTTYARGGNVK